jgi:hypothetical protein
MGETSDKSQQLLGDTELSDSFLLRLRQEGEEGDNLLAKKFCFATVSKTWTELALHFVITEALEKATYQYLALPFWRLAYPLNGKECRHAI